MPIEGRLFVMGIAILNFVTSMVSERWIFPWISKLIGVLFMNKDGGAQGRVERWKAKGKTFKAIEYEFQSNEV